MNMTFSVVECKCRFVNTKYKRWSKFEKVKCFVVYLMNVKAVKIPKKDKA